MVELASFDDLPAVRRVRASIRKYWGLEVGLALRSGYVATHARGVVVPSDNAYCKASLARADTFQMCNRSVEQAVAALAETPPGSPRALRVETCHLGLSMLFVPLVWKDFFLGALFTGGFFLQDEVPARLKSVHDASRQLGLSVPTPATAESVVGLRASDYQVFCDLMEMLADELLTRPGVVDTLMREQGIQAEADELIQFEAIVGRSPVMQKLYSLIERVAPSDSTVLITGEDGTGKELVAHAIYARSKRNDRPFVIRNCSAFNDNLLESELFGHTRGAFTGADRDRRGVFELADTGTLFLDEVGDTSTAMQVKLLRVLQDGSFVPVGGATSRRSDVRVVAATNRPLLDMVKKETFRKDLYYRLNVINLHLPPLRDRPEDLPHLCDYFLERLAVRSDGPRKSLAPSVVQRFYGYEWPGNIRELQSEIERLYVLSGDAVVIRDEFVSPHVGGTTSRRRPAWGSHRSLSAQVSELERDVIAQGLVRTQWNKKRLAEELGISRTTLIRKIREYDLEGPKLRGRS